MEPTILAKTVMIQTQRPETDAQAVRLRQDGSVLLLVNLVIRFVEMDFCLEMKTVMMIMLR